MGLAEAVELQENVTQRGKLSRSRTKKVEGVIQVVGRQGWTGDEVGDEAGVGGLFAVGNE